MKIKTKNLKKDNKVKLISLSTLLKNGEIKKYCEVPKCYISKDFGTVITPFMIKNWNKPCKLLYISSDRIYVESTEENVKFGINPNWIRCRVKYNEESN